MSGIPLSLLQHFVAAARLGNLSRAAAQAHLTVSALSHRIRQLEERLERKLFERGPRGVRLTADGRRLLDAVGGHFDGIEQAMSAYRCRRHDVLTLSAIPAMLSGWLVPRLPRLVTAFPELELNLQSSVALVDFAREPAVDAALRYGRGGWPALHSEHLFDEWIAPVAAPALLARHPQLDPGSPEGWPLLGDPSERWRDWFAQTGVRPPARYVAQFDTTEALQRAALEGMGVALARLVMARPLIEAGLLHVMGERNLHIEEAYYLVYPQRSSEHRGLQRFRGWLREEADSYARDTAALMSRPPATCAAGGGAC